MQRYLEVVCERNARIGEQLQATQDDDNTEDRFAIALTKNSQTVDSMGHSPVLLLDSDMTANLFDYHRLITPQKTILVFTMLLEHRDLQN